MRIVRSEKTNAAAFGPRRFVVTPRVAQAAWRYSSSASRLITEVASSVSV